MSADIPSIEDDDPEIERMYMLMDLLALEEERRQLSRDIRARRAGTRKKLEGTTGLAFLRARRHQIDADRDELLLAWQESASADRQYLWTRFLSGPQLLGAVEDIYCDERERAEKLLREFGPATPRGSRPVILPFPQEKAS